MDWYNLGYYENTLRLNSGSAELICGIRWDFLADIRPRTVLDYGAGVGWFRAWRPEGVEVDSYDVGPSPQTGITRDTYDVLCLWDVLEHLPGFVEIDHLLKSCRHVALTVPCLPAGQDIRTWHHYKPQEHLHIFTEETIEALFDVMGFDLVKKGTPECPPRRDITSFLFESRCDL